MGYCYSVNNKYNLRLCVVFLKRKKIKYTLFDEYMVIEKKIKEFDGSNYYIKYIGEVPIKKYKNNCVEVQKTKKTSIYNCDCEFKKGTKRYTLMLSNGKKYIFKRIKKYDWLFDKIFIEKGKEFFEFNFNQIYMDDNTSMVDNLNFDKKKSNGCYFNEDEIFHEIEDEIVDLREYEEQKIQEVFDITHVFDDMTENQVKILGLTLLKVSAKAISILMKTSPTYILLERRRIVKKIKKLLEKEHYNENRFLEEKEDDIRRLIK